MLLEMKDDVPGAIRCEEAYAQGKMWDGSGWNLPRGSTPMDIDIVWDNNGRLIFGELERITSWDQMRNGPKRLYHSLISACPASIAVLMTHDTPPTQQIDTTQLISFQPLFWYDTIRYAPIYDGSRWVPFVNAWFDNPDAVLVCLIANSGIISTWNPSALGEKQ